MSSPKGIIDFIQQPVYPFRVANGARMAADKTGMIDFPHQRDSMLEAVKESSSMKAQFIYDIYSIHETGPISVLTQSLTARTKIGKIATSIEFPIVLSFDHGPCIFW